MIINLCFKFAILRIFHLIETKKNGYRLAETLYLFFSIWSTYCLGSYA